MAKILIAEDMSVIREPIAIALERAGHEILEASNGQDAISLLQGQEFELLLLDIHMPEMSGIEVLRRIRSDAQLRTLPVILLTDDSDRETVRQAAALGVRNYVLKASFSIDLLLRRVSAALEGSKPSQHESGPSHVAAEPTVPLQPRRASARSSVALAMSAEEAVESLKALKPIVRRSEFLERLDECGELKAMSPTVAEVLKLSQGSSASTDQISRAIRRDQALSLKVLCMANSAAYASHDPVDSIEKAVVRIGLKAIGQAVLNISVVDHFGSDPAHNPLDPILFWEHSIGCGIIAARIAQAINSVPPDTAFTLGLIHDVGRCVCMQMFGEQYESILTTARELELPLEVVEKRMLMLSHADGMDRILHRWQFPRDLVDPIVFHHLSIGNIRRMAAKRVAEVATLALANRLAHAMMIGSSGNDAIYSTHEFCEALRVQPRTIMEIESSARDETDDLKFAMLAGSTGGVPVDSRVGLRELFGEPFRPLFISARPEIDAYRVFCGQLADPGDEPPNIGIIHMTDPRETESLSRTFKAAETEACSQAIPLLILSPSGKLIVEQGLLAGRVHECLSTPIIPSRMARTVRQLVGVTDSAKAA